MTEREIAAANGFVFGVFPRTFGLCGMLHLPCYKKINEKRGWG